jgi:hypothetical protein
MASTVAGRVAGGALVWLLGLGLAAAVAHPESCLPPTQGAARAAVADAVRWLHGNQADDGHFLYRYDRVARRVEPGYDATRHAGTLLALEQAAGQDIPAAAATAERAIGWAMVRLTPLDGGRVALSGDTGASALLIAALVERRRIDGDDRYDADLAALGRFVAGAVTPDGAVVATWDLAADRAVEGSRSRFFTGEVLFALAGLHATFPETGWDVVARRVSRYVSTRRDDGERRFPPVSDHWSAYGFAEMAAWPGGTGLTADDVAYARRQVGLMGLQARFESQRRAHGFARLTRGATAVPAGLGTLGEGLGAIRRAATSDPGLAVDRAAVDERLACVAGLLVARQRHDTDPRVDGAWFRGHDTEVDDQQHAISALLASGPVLGARS